MDYPQIFLIDMGNIRNELARRKPGQSNITTQRKEDDENFEVLSGLFEWKTTGHPVTIIVKNSDQKSGDYSNIKDLFGPIMRISPITWSMEWETIEEVDEAAEEKLSLEWSLELLLNSFYWKGSEWKSSLLPNRLESRSEKYRLWFYRTE